MGRGRNGLIIQNPSKHRKSIVKSKNNENSIHFQRPPPCEKEEDFFLDPNYVAYLRSLNPRDVAKALTSDPQITNQC